MGALLYSTIPTISCLLWGIKRKLKLTEAENTERDTLKPKEKGYKELP